MDNSRYDDDEDDNAFSSGNENETTIPTHQDIESSAESSTTPTSTSSGKSKRKSDSVSKLVDNKRKHLQRNLSSAQRDKILIDEAKDDAMFRKEMVEAIKDSTRCFTESVNTLGTSMVQMTNSIGRSIEVLAQALVFDKHSTQPQPNFGYYPSQGHPQGPSQGYYMSMVNQENPNGNINK